MRRLLLLLLTVLLLTGFAAAYEIPEDFSDLTLDEALEEFRTAFFLNESNFSLCYYSPETGDSYAWNENWFSIAASTYKLPLNMYFYEMQQAGELSGDTVITWTGQTLDHIHEKSIVNSNNELSEALMYYWGDHYTYKEKMRKYFTMTDEEISPLYWQANWYCTDMMMDCLKYLYENRENFEELIGYLKQAMPDRYFKQGVTEYEVAHKYGAVQTYHNDVGIIYTPQPFLLAVYTQGVGETVCADAAKLLTTWQLWQCGQDAEDPVEVPPEPAARPLPLEPVVSEEAVPEEEALPAELPVPEEEPEAPVTVPEPEQKTSVYPVAAAVIAGAVLLSALLRKLRKT